MLQVVDILIFGACSIIWLVIVLATVLWAARRLTDWSHRADRQRLGDSIPSKLTGLEPLERRQGLFCSDEILLAPLGDLPQIRTAEASETEEWLEEPTDNPARTPSREDNRPGGASSTPGRPAVGAS